MIYFFTGLGIFLLFLYTSYEKKKFATAVLADAKIIQNAFNELSKERDELLEENKNLKEKALNFSSEISKFSFTSLTPEQNKEIIKKLNERYNWYLLGNALNNLSK